MSKKVSPKTTIIKLEYPFVWKQSGEEKEITQIELARPKGKHLKGIGSDPGMSDMFRIASKIAKESWVTPAFFEEMDAADCMQITEVIGDFLDGGTKTGETA